MEILLKVSSAYYQRFLSRGSCQENQFEAAFVTWTLTLRPAGVGKTGMPAHSLPALSVENGDTVNASLRSFRSDKHSCVCKERGL